MNILIRLIVFTCLLTIIPGLSYAYESETTHRTLNENIAYISDMDQNLNRIGFPDGVATIIDEIPVSEWLSLGGIEEDEPLLNPRYHFHDPLSGSWGQAGLFHTNTSSVLWAQNPDNDWSWPSARKYFYAALTGDSTEFEGGPGMNETEKGVYFAMTFKALGHLMHLVEDSSVPSHARDDAHVVESVLKLNNYERTVGRFGDRNNDLFTPELFENAYENYVTFAPSILAQEPNPLAPIPIAKIIDTDQYTRESGPNITTGNSIGLAEYTNANFFSEDTINAREYPHPDIENCAEVVTLDHISFNDNIYQREYFRKSAEPSSNCGETNNGQGYLLSAVDWLDYWRQKMPIFSFLMPVIPVLDTNVYRDYASLLLPRAVGYSASLLDYFFRGTMEISPPSDGFYALTDDLQQGFNRVKLQAKNTTPDNEEMINGTIELVVKYHLSGGEFSYITALEADEVSGITRDEFVELTFDLSQTPIPLWATDVNLQVVFKGELGNESEAVAIGSTDIFLRHSMLISLPSDGFYALTDDPQQGFNQVKLRAKNLGPFNPELSDGTIELIVKYRLSEGDPFTNNYSDTSWEFSNIIVPEANNVSSIPGDDFVELTFNLGQTPIPLWATDVYLQVVYNAYNDQPGTEKPGPVAVGFKDISEPTPVDLFNNCDKICFFSNWRDTGTASIIEQVDSPSYGGNDNDIVDEWDIFNHNLKNTYYLFWPDWWVGGVTAPDPGAGLYNYHIPLVGPGQFHRGPYVLTNYVYYYTFLTNMEPRSGADEWGHLPIAGLEAKNAIKNQIEWSYFHGYYIRYLPNFTPFRGLETWGLHLIYPLPYPGGSSCSYWDL